MTECVMVSEERTFATVSRVQARLRKLLEPALNASPFWLRAELSSVSHSNGRLYCDLVELKEGKVVAKFRCTIWPRDLSAIKTRLKAARLDELLEDGNEVGVQCKIQYHELYGMSVNAVDIDPNASLGALERKKQEIIARLLKDKLLDKNAERFVPFLPKRIGLVASRDTAGYKDFVTTLTASGYSVQIFAADARVEGRDTERTVLRALEVFNTLEVDLIVILRGGGSRVSLSYLDNEAIARAIAFHRFAVWSAIGHEIDTSVLDSVVHTSFKTPTAVAEYIVSHFVEAEEKLKNAYQSMQSTVQLRLRPERQRIDSVGEQLLLGVTRFLKQKEDSQKNTLGTFALLVKQRIVLEDSSLENASVQLRALAKNRSAIAIQVLVEHHKSLGKTIGRTLLHKSQEKERIRKRLTSPTAFNRLKVEERRCEVWRQILRVADPARNLERGYALVYDLDGNLVRSAKSLEGGQHLVTHMVDGQVQSIVDSTSSGE